MPANSSSFPARWSVFSSAPHRMLFFAGVLQTLLVMGFWLAELLGRVLPGGGLALSLVAIHAHSFLMIYGIFPFFIFGFLFTVYPRWMGGKVIARRAYITSFALLGGGMLLFYLGLYTRTPIIMLAVALVLSGWIVAWISLYQVFLRAHSHGMHERLLNLALAAGALGVATFLAALLTGSPFAFTLARVTGLWLFLVPVLFLVSHRMIPFFSQSGLMNYMMVRPAWGPPVMLILAAGHALLELAGLPEWRFLADVPMAIAALHHSWVWQFRRSFHARLVAMLHIAFLWLGIGMSLYALQSLALLITGSDPFGRAPLHALAIGFFAGMVVAMASRVMLGHSGRALAADTITWLALLGINVTAILRIAGELPAVGATFNLLAALAWLAAFLPWVWRYLPITLLPRADRQPG